MRMTLYTTRLLLSLWLCLLTPVAFALFEGELPQPDETITLDITGGNEINVLRFAPAKDNNDVTQRVLWVPSEYGFRKESEYRLARHLANAGIEVWLTNLHDDYFLPISRDSLTEIPTEEMAELIELSLPEKAEQRLYLMSYSRGAALLVRALKTWQTARTGDSRYGGLILVHPNLTADIAEPGKPITYLPVAHKTSSPVFIIQPEKSGRHWYLDELIAALEEGGSHVRHLTLPGISDGYLGRPERTDAEIAEAKRFPERLKDAMTQLAAIEIDAETGGRGTQSKQVAKWEVSSMKEGLQPYPGNEPAPPLKLAAIDGKTYDINDYRGKVVLLNFWATWCPPCVKEIPSLGRLQDKFSKDDFVVLSVDMGETKEEVETFLEKVPADYPVMLDPDGTLVKDWKLRAFPTTFVLDAEGYIRLAYFGGLEWDEQPVVDTLVEHMKLQPRE